MRNDDGDDYERYTIRNRKIKFADTYTYTVTYVKYPAPLTATTGSQGTPDLPDMFRYALAKFLAA